MVPNGWEAVEVDDLAKFSSGGTPSKQNEEYWNGSEPWISGKDLKTHYLCSSIDKLTEKGFAAAKKAPKGSTLVLVRGMTLLKDFPVGYATRELSFNQDIKALVPLKNVDGLYLSFLLSGDKHKIMNLVSTAGHGTGRLDTNLLKQHPVNLPPFSEQQKIAKILSTWDKAISTTERLIDNSTQQKKALMQQLLTGKKRLLDESGERFEGEWRFSNFEDLFKVANNKKTQIKSSDYLDEGALPIVDQGKRLVSGYTNNNEVYSDIPVIVFGDHTRIVKWIDFEFAQGADGTQVLKNAEGLHAKFAYYILLNADIPNLGYSRHMRELKERDFKYPLDKTEQQKIATVLTNADKEIELLEQQLADLQQEKKALMQVLLTGKKRVVVDGEVLDGY